MACAMCQTGARPSTNTTACSSPAAPVRTRIPFCNKDITISWEYYWDIRPAKSPPPPRDAGLLDRAPPPTLFLLFLLLGRLLPPASQRLVQGDHIEGLLDAAGFQLLTGIEQGALGDQHIKEIAQALVE